MPRITTAEYHAMLARTRNPVPGRLHGAPSKSERELHEKIVEECRHRGWIVWRSRMDKRTSRPMGEPDLHIRGDDGREWLIECKQPEGKLSQQQRATIAWLEKLGHTVHVVRTFDEFIGVIEK